MSAADPQPSGPRAARGPLSVAAAIGAAIALAGAHLVVELALPRGAVEFAYSPDHFLPLPFAAMRGFTVEQLALHASRLLLLGPALALLAWSAARLGRWRPLDAAGWRRLRRIAVAVSLVVAAATLLGLRGRPLVDDELTYRAQAGLVADGRLADPSLPPFGQEAFTIRTRRGTTGKYLPGEAVVQAPGVLLGLPGLVHLPLLALALWAFRRAVAEAADSTVADAATALLALSPMLMLTSGTGLTHTTALACIAAAGLGAAAVGARPGSGAPPRSGSRDWLGAVASAAGLGAAVLVRPQAAAPALATLGVWTAWRLVSARRWGPLALWLALLGAAAAAVALYDLWLTGSPWTLPWSLHQPVERYGFGAVYAGRPYEHTIVRALENLLVTAVRMNGWWLGWPASLALVGLWFAVGRPRRGLAPWLLLGAAEVVFLFGYYSPGVSETGPVYYFELLLPLSLLGGQALVAAGRRWGAPVTAWLVVHLLLGTGSFVVEQGARLARFVDAVHRPAERVLASLPRPALLVHENSNHEGLRRGWVLSSFPFRYRRDADPVVTFPRGGPDSVAALIGRYPERRCFYVHAPRKDGIDTAEPNPEVLTCRDAAAFLARPEIVAGAWVPLRSTARSRGWIR